MHDVIRELALWIACDYEKEKENFLVYAGVGLTKVPDIRDWEKVRGLTLMKNKIENLLRLIHALIFSLSFLTIMSFGRSPVISSSLCLLSLF